MDWGTIGILVGAMAAWAAVVVGAVTYLHGRAADARNRKFDDLDDKIEHVRTEQRQDHEAVRQQIGREAGSVLRQVAEIRSRVDRLVDAGGRNVHRGA